MNSLLKKYSKPLFAVLSAFLMLIFILPSVMKNNNDVSGLEVGRLNGQKVTNGSIQSASANVNLLARFGLLGNLNPRLPGSLSLSQGILTLAGPIPDPRIPYPLYINVPVAYLNEAGTNTHDTERGTHWFLLLTEAQRLGILADPTEVSALFANAAANLANGDNQQFIQFLYNQNITESQFRGAIAQALMIRNLAEITMRNIPPSVPAVELAATERFATLAVDYASLDAAQDFAKFPDPTPDQVKKQFDTYKSVVATPPGSTATPPTIDGHTYPFGYKYPDRVKVEYLKFDRKELARQFKPTHDDLDEAFRYYKSHPEDPIITPPADDAATQPTQPAKKSFDDVREVLVQRQVDDRINKFLKRITDRVASTTSVPWADAKDVNGFREAIPRAKWVDYKSIPATLKTMPEFAKYQPEYDAIDTFESARQLAAIPGIGSAAYDHQGSPIPFAALATHVHELGDFPDFPRLYLQVGIDGPILKDDDGNLYIYRVTDADKSHEPASLDEVRTQVVDDLKKLASFQQKEKEAKSIAEIAATGNFSGVARAHGLTPVTTPEFRHSDPNIPGLGNVPGFADAAYELGRGEEPTSQPASAPASQPAAKPVLNRTTTLPDDAALKVYILALTKFNPVTPLAFAAERKPLINLVSQEGGIQFATAWLGFDNTLKREKYVPTHPFNEK